MTLRDELARHGLTSAGDPPALAVVIAGIDVPVVVDETEHTVSLRAALSIPEGTPEQDLIGLTLSAPGDTALGIKGNELAGSRTLIKPTTLGELYDAIYDLAKVTLATTRSLQELAELQALIGDLEVAGDAPDPAWAATHKVPPGGIRTWPAPDKNAPEGPVLSPSLPVQVLEQRETWAYIKCSNTWTGWVEADQLQSL